jgi:transposase
MNLINRYFRRYKSIPYSKKGKTFQIDADMYKYKRENDKLFIEFSSLKKAKRLRIGLTDKVIHSGNLRVILREQSLEIHSALNIKQKKLWLEKNVVGIDKGYKNLFATSSNNLYGSGLNKLLSKETERLNTKNAKRNRIWSQMKNFKENGELEKAERILKNNFGKKKNEKQKNKYDEQVKSLINYEINNLIKIEKPSELVSEDLSFVSWTDKYPKHVKRILSRWIKGYIRERLEFKCEEYSIKYTLVNAAYTSQICSKCERFGKRKNETFDCLTCGKMHADLNASVNIKQRKNDKKITLFTPYKQVKKILEERQKKILVA